MRHIERRKNDPEKFSRDDFESFLISRVRGFQNFTKSRRPLLCNAIEFESHSSGKYIIREGHVPNAFYFTLSGKLEIMKVINGQECRLNVLGPGTTFGLLTLSSDGKDKRSASVATIEPTELLRVDKLDYLPIAINETKVRLENKNKLLQLPDFESVPTEIIDKIVQFAQFVSYDPQQVVSAEGTPNFQILWVISGSCRCIRYVPFIQKKQADATTLVPYDETASLKPGEKVVNEILTIAELKTGYNFPYLPEFDDFGSVELMVADKERYMQRLRDEPPKINKVSLVANTNVVIMTISQLEFVQIANLKMISMLMSKDSIFEAPMSKLYDAFDEKKKWNAMKESVRKEISNKKKM